MLPHSYIADSLSLSQDLADAILSSSTLPQISSACASVNSFLLSHTPDQSRHFFSITFPTLICKLFGFDSATSPPGVRFQSPSSVGWVDAILESNEPGVADRVFSLLSPNGTLMNSISEVDRVSLVKYVFPTERLPKWVRFMLSGEKDCRVIPSLCPLFKDKLEEDAIKRSTYQIHLNVFDYYMFWFAYYPICRENRENLVTVSTRMKKDRIDRWTSSIRSFPGSSKRERPRKIECNLYLRLLYAYLDAYVPTFDLGAHHQASRSSLLHNGNAYDASAMVRAEFFVTTLVQYWLVENDFSPLPLHVSKSFGVFHLFRPVPDEIPPTCGLGEVLKLLVKYLDLSSARSRFKYDGNVAYHDSPRQGALDVGISDVVKTRDAALASPVVCQVGSWNSYIQRPLYRFLLRTFLFCPIGSSIKNASEVFSVWVTYMEPWVISWNDLSELEAVVNGSSKFKRNCADELLGYTPLWQDYVLSNYLYYSSLVLHFVGFAHKFLHTDPEAILQMVLKVMDILASSKDLVHLIKCMDSVFHSKEAGSSGSKLNNLHRYVPSIREQLQDWEYGLCENDADGSFLHENWNKDLRLFSEGEDGGSQLFQLFIMRAEAELQASPGTKVLQNLEHIDLLKAQVSRFFGSHAIKPIPMPCQTQQHGKIRGEIFKPRKIGNRAFADVKYKGDWMCRPISEDEVACIAKLLINLSCWLNEKLRLNQQQSKETNAEESYMEISPDVRNVNGLEEVVKVFLGVLVSWLATSAAAVLRLMRRHGLKFNLRFLASKKLLTALLVYVVFCVVKKAFRSVS